jgi:hypothetical protein
MADWNWKASGRAMGRAIRGAIAACLLQTGRAVALATERNADRSIVMVMRLFGVGGCKSSREAMESFER